MSNLNNFSIKQEIGLAVGVYFKDKRLNQFLSWEAAGRFMDRLFNAHQESTRVYEVWYPSWSAQGNLNNPAVKIGEIEANSFKEACDKIVPNSPYANSYDSDKLSVWAGLLCDNEKEANDG